MQKPDYHFLDVPCLYNNFHLITSKYERNDELQKNKYLSNDNTKTFCCSDISKVSKISLFWVRLEHTISPERGEREEAKVNGENYGELWTFENGQNWAENICDWALS